MHRARATGSSAGGTLRVAVVAACPFPAPRGTPTRILRLSEALARQGHEVHLVTYHFGARAYAPVEPNLLVHRIPGVPGHDRLDPGPSLRKLFVHDPRLVRRLRAVLADMAIDVIHGHHYEGVLVGAAARRGTAIPLVYDAHTLLAEELPHYFRRLPRPWTTALGRALDRRVPRLADGILTVSEELERELAPLMASRDRVCTVPNGVELDIFPQRGAARSASDSSRRQERIVMYTGTLASYQGIEMLLFSFARLLAARRDVVLKIVSDSSFEPYETLSRELGVRARIQVVHAQLAQLSGLLEEADVAVNPRIDCSGLPQKNLNYMAAGIPIVCFAGSAKQLVAGDTALVVDDGDVEAFAGAIAYVLDNPGPAAMLGARARRYVEAHSSWDASALKATRFYAELVRKRQGLAER